MCKELTALSKCRKVKVASMLVNNGRIISTGVNGSIPGECNCDEHFKHHTQEEFLREHSEWSLKNESHAEMNALLYAAKSSAEITESTIMYCTHEPCNNCLKHIGIVGIKEIYYIDKYYNNIKDNSKSIQININE